MLAFASIFATHAEGSPYALLVADALAKAGHTAPPGCQLRRSSLRDRKWATLEKEPFAKNGKNIHTISGKSEKVGSAQRKRENLLKRS